MSWEIILKELACPRATQDLKLNTKNRNMAIEAEHIKYGPLNLSDDQVIVSHLIFLLEWKNVCH